MTLNYPASQDMGEVYGPGVYCELPGTHRHNCVCGYSAHFLCEINHNRPTPCANCGTREGWVRMTVHKIHPNPPKEDPVAASPIITAEAKVEMIQPHLGRKVDMSPHEALEAAAEFCDRTKMWPQPNARGYFDKDTISSSEKTSVVLRVAMFLMMGIDPNRVKDETFSFPAFKVPAYEDRD